MIKRTLYFGNPAYLKMANEQLVIEMHDSGETKTAPIEDIGFLCNGNLLVIQYQQSNILNRGGFGFSAVMHFNNKLFVGHF
jgi:CRISPR-associated protein Cas1